MPINSESIASSVAQQEVEPHLSAEVVIVGAGPAGSILALELHNQGKQVLMVEPLWEDEAIVDTEKKKSSRDYPVVIAGNTFHAIFPNVNYKEVSLTKFNVIGKFGFIIRMLGDLYRSRKPLVTTTMSAIRENLWEQLEQAGISVIKGEAKELIWNKDQISGVRIHTASGVKTVESSLVVDATGRDRRLLKQMPEVQNLTETEQKTRLYGMKLQLPHDFPTPVGMQNVWKMANAAIVRGIGCGVCLSPLTKLSQRDTATHIFFLEGDTERLKNLKASQDSAQALTNLTEFFAGTVWQRLFESVKPEYVDEVYSWGFKNQQALDTSSFPPGFLAVGDAAFNVNFTTARGVQEARKAAHLIAENLAAGPITQDLITKANQTYQERLQEAAPKHLTYFKIAGLLLGSGWK